MTNQLVESFASKVRIMATTMKGGKTMPTENKHQELANHPKVSISEARKING
jgi:hypothetical protein